jgi:alcohol dehydrogenase
MTAGRFADALVLDGPRALSRRSFPIPQISETDGLLRVEACGLCGTDNGLYTGDIRYPYSFVPGHEVVGIVEEAGEQALQRWGVTRGDRVIVETLYSCRTCDRCTAGEYRLCREYGPRNRTGPQHVGGIDVDRPPSLWGGYSTYLYLPPATLLLKVPDGLNPITASLFNALGAGVRWGVTLPQTKTGDLVAVMGCGVRGLFACLAAKRAGAKFVMVTTEDPLARLLDSCGEEADVVVHATARAPESLPQAVSLVRPGGTISFGGQQGDVPAQHFYPDLVVKKGITIIGALAVGIPAYEAALELLINEPATFADLPTGIAGFNDLERLLAAMAGEGTGSRPLRGVFVPAED